MQEQQQGEASNEHAPLSSLIHLSAAYSAQILDVSVGAESYVIGEIPADVIGIVIDDDVIGIPQPAVYKAEVIGSNAKEESIEAEALRTSSPKPIDVIATDLAAEVSVCPGMIEMIAGIVRAGVVPDPLIVCVDVRRFRMARLVSGKARRRSVAASILTTMILSTAILTSRSCPT